MLSLVSKENLAMRSVGLRENVKTLTPVSVPVYHLASLCIHKLLVLYTSQEVLEQIRKADRCE